MSCAYVPYEEQDKKFQNEYNRLFNEEKMTVEINPGDTTRNTEYKLLLKDYNLRCCRKADSI